MKLVSCNKRCLSAFLALVVVFSSLFTFEALPAAAAGVTQAVYYVSPTGNDSNDGSIGAPFQTITKARDAVRAINSSMTGDIYVYLRGGDYRLTGTVSFGPEDSGTNGFRIYYQAYPGETPVLNGATKVTGWTKSGLINGIDGIYEATLDRSTKLRYLFVNDKRAQMTKKAAKGQGGYGTYSVVKGQADWAWQSGSNSDGVKYNLSDVPEITSNKDDLEIVNGSTWNENIVCTRDVITSSDGLSRVLQLQQPYGAMAQTPGWGAAFTTTSSHTIYNAIEFMKNPGEFYFDKTAKKLYYYPRAGENMDTANVEAPFVEKLIDLKGTSNTDRIKNITFKGITFANTDWNLMEVGGSYGRTTCQSADGYIAYYGNGNWHDTAYTLLDTYPGMINVKSADSIDFMSNTIKHSGADGVSMVNDVINSNLIGNYIYDITASGITIGHPQHVYLDDSMDKSADAANNKNRQVYAAGVEGICTNVVINNNMLWDCSTAPGFGGCAGITSFFSDGLKITYNTVHTSGYNGITLGWGWCNFQNSTSCRDNDISYNRIYNALNRLHDSGAIYTIGQMPGTKINNNYVNGIPDKSSGPTYGLHNDEGTTYIEENNNVLDISPDVTYTINCEDFGQKHHLTIHDTYATTYKMGKNPPDSTIDVPVIVPDNVWPTAQYNIALNAGVQEEYRNILPGHLFPVQDYVFPASCSVTQGTISIRSSGDAANSVWFAPAGTASFVEGAAMTKAAGTATSIAIPATAGIYKLFVVDSSNSVVGESKAILRVNASDGIEKAVQADDFKANGTLGSQWTVKNEDNTNYSFVSDGLQIATQAGELSDDSIKNLVMQNADGDWVAQTKVTLSAAQSQSGQQVGLVVYGDSKNYLKLDYERGSSSSTYGFYNSIDGTKTIIGNTANGGTGIATVNNQLVHYFRLVKSGAKYSAYYSTDDITYNLIGSTASCIDPKIGLIACNGTATASINATFEYLKIGTPADIDKDASLSGITVDGNPLSGFDSNITNYNMYVSDTVTTAPAISATPVDPGANVSIQDAASLPGTTTITVSNGYNKKIYKVSFGSTMKYEAEYAALSGGAELNHDNAGYSGEGYVQGYIFSGTACTSFKVNVSKAGKYTLDLRYAAGFSNVTNIGLYVNGALIKNPTFNSTGGWTKWANAIETVTLNSGENTIEYKVNSAGTFDCINLDYITLTKVADEFAPTWPENSSIKITNLSETGLTIVWPVAVDNVAVTGYRIYNGINLLTTVAGDVNSYDISGLIAGTDYTIKVEAGDAFGNWSADGPSASFTTLGGPDTTAPTWPQNSTIAASEIFSNGLTLTWPAAQDDRVLSNYRIYKGSDLLATVAPAGINRYDVSGLTADTEYTFRVEAGDLTGNWSTNGPVNVIKTNSAIKLEAENATLSGSAGINSTEHKGFSGTGYVDGNNQENASTSFKVNVPSAGTYTVSLRYATHNGNPSTNMGLYVNGTKLKNLTCNETANWDTWDNVIETVTLNSGENTVEFKTGSFSWDCINIDYIVITKAADSASDTTAPAWPQASTVTASAIGINAVTLNWTPAVDDSGVTGYEIYNGTDKIGTVAGNINSYEVMNLGAGTEYTFSVQAGDQAGNISADGPAVTLSTLPDNGQGDTQAPTWTEGSNITVSEIAENSLNLTWPAAQDNTAVTGYVIYNGDTQLASVPGNVTSYNVSGLTAATQYTFTIKAKDASSNWSEPGLSVTETTKAGEPQDTAAPAWLQGNTLVASDISSTGFTLTWPAAQDNTGVTSYRIYKDSVLISTVPGNTNSYYVSGLSSGTTYLFTVQAGDAANNWSSNGPSANATTEASSSGNGGGNGGSGGSTTTPAETATPGKVKISAPVVDAAMGIAKVAVDANALARALAEAMVAKVEIPKTAGASAYVTSLPSSVLVAGDASKAIQVVTASAAVTVPLNMLSATDLTGADRVELSIEKVDTSRLDSAKKAAIGDKPVFDIKLMVNGREKAWSNPGAALTIRIPYTPTPAELANSEYLTVWYMDSNGRAVRMQDAKYVPAEKAMVFTTTHLSKYAVVYTKKDFGDMQRHSWAAEAVKALTADGIIEGTSDTAFSPAQKITREEYVAWLVRTLGLTADFQDNFRDVKTADKYYREIGIAKALGISAGFDGEFSPEREISRQELVSMAINALKAADKALEKGTAKDIGKYTDAGKIAKYAVENMATMVRMGFITGDSKTTLNPAGATTRAEAAAILYKIYSKKW